MVERILLKRSVQHRVKTPPNVTFLHICDPVIWFKNQGSYTGFAKEGKISILLLSNGGSDHLLVIEDDIRLFILQCICEKKKNGLLTNSERQL